MKRIWTVGFVAIMLAGASSAQAVTTHGISWTKNGSPIWPAQKQQMIGWGTLTIQTPNQTVTCRGAEAANIETLQAPGEEIPIKTWAGAFDLALIYNCLQHVDDPEKIVANACAAAKELRMFEWINIPPHEGHPHELKADLLEKWAGRQGRVVDLPECGGVAWVLGPPPVPGARKSRIVLGGA